MNVAAHKMRPPLHPLERGLLSVLAVELVLMPWLWGTMHSWSQSIALGLSLAAFALALWPRRYLDELAPEGEFRLQAWPRLLRFPLFWLGLALLLLLLLQAANVAWVWESDERSWWLRSVDHVAWLPSSTDTPFATYNVWRSFLIYAAAWLAVCALWVGVTRRRSLQILFWVMLGNAVVSAGAGFAHRFSGETKTLWLRSFKDAVSFSSFVYQNHGGAYFGLLAAAALGMAVWHFYEGRRRMARSTPTSLWVFVTGFLAFAVLFSFSRGAVITFALFAVGAVLAMQIVRAANPVPSTTPRIVVVALGAVFLGSLAPLVWYADFSTLEARFRELMKLGQDNSSVWSRAMAREAAWDMYQRYWLLGSGAGSFRYLFPVYVQNYPEIYEGGRAFWEHAHIDWLEIPIELGLTGVLLIAGAFGWTIWRYLRLRGWRHGVTTMVLLGCCQTLLHAAIDFPFQNPAVLTAWWVLLAASLRWLELDSLAEKRA